MSEIKIRFGKTNNGKSISGQHVEWKILDVFALLAPVTALQRSSKNLRKLLKKMSKKFHEIFRPFVSSGQGCTAHKIMFIIYISQKKTLGYYCSIKVASKCDFNMNIILVSGLSILNKSRSLFLLYFHRLLFSLRDTL